MLSLVATPIGNLKDISQRAIEVLRSVEYILAEDTRKTGLLLHRYGIKKKLVSFYEHNEKKKLPEIIQQLKAGKEIALVSSAGMPTISDPGYTLVRACRQEAIPVTVIPGANSIVTALAATGLAHERFAFLGYAPRKKGERQRLLETARGWGVTLVFLESPYRVCASLQDIQKVMGEVDVCVARELTKKFEEVIEGPLATVLASLTEKKPKGEVVVIVAHRKKKKKDVPEA